MGSIRLPDEIPPGIEKRAGHSHVGCGFTRATCTDGQARGSSVPEGVDHSPVVTARVSIAPHQPADRYASRDTAC